MTIGIAQALANIRPTSNWILRDTDYAGIEWLDEANPMPTEQEVNDEIIRLEAQVPLDACKAEAKTRLANTDWSVLPDVVVQNKLDFENYRSAVRALVLNPVADPVWPTEPQPVWSK